VDRIRLLRNPIRAYAWGSCTALARLQGRPSPSAGPEAELWIGAHPAAPSSVVVEGGAVPLPEWIARDPARVLGSEASARFGGGLPFLLKILALARPLSLQVHPDAARARAGFARETRAGIPLDAPERCYREPRAKPELVCALAPFRTLAGFRPPAEILARFESLLPTLPPWLAPLRARPDAAGWRAAFETLLRAAPGASGELVAEAARAARSRAGADGGLAWLPRLAELHPEDPAALAPVFLHEVALAPGEALFLPPGLLHCYLEGLAVEVMASCDNVVRGGLTPKPVDVTELLAVARFEADAPAPLLPRPVSPAEGVYPAPCAEFRLAALCPRGAPVEGEGFAVVLCTEGAVRVRALGGGEPLEIGPGAALLVPASAGRHRVDGRGLAWRVSIPPLGRGRRPGLSRPAGGSRRS